METKLRQLQKDRFETQKILDGAVDFIVSKGLYDEYMKFKNKNELGGN